MQLLSSADRGVQEQAVWALGNIVGDGAECRDIVIREGVIHPLVSLIQPNMPVSENTEIYLQILYMQTKQCMCIEILRIDYHVIFEGVTKSFKLQYAKKLATTQ